ncbi:hypothetical protein F4777DRAFT_575233 [Nemania sp. FL0916]|nr:hypothetical protein F4777DRAFT_575233 [Nemania sp. FL0916]
MPPILSQAGRLAPRFAARTSLRHPVFRRSFFGKSDRQPKDWGQFLKARAAITAMYLPGIGFVLGWPWIAYKIVDTYKCGWSWN